MHSSPELGHGRIDIRSIRYLHVTPTQVNFPCIQSLVQVNRDSTNKKTGAQTKGARIFLSSRAGEAPANILAKVRERWNVENKNHHPRDATFLEDKSRCRTGNTTANLALLRGIGLTIWKKTQPKRPATDFIRSNNRKIDAQIALMNKNQRLTTLQ